MGFSTYKHALLSLALFSNLENVRKTGQVLRVRPDSEWGPLGRVYLPALSISLECRPHWYSHLGSVPPPPVPFSCFFPLLCLKNKQKILFSGGALFLSINREEGSRMGTDCALSKLGLFHLAHRVQSLLPHSWNLAKPTLTRLVYVSFISESTFPHWFLLIRPVRSCFAGPRRVRSHCATAVGSNSLDKPRNDVICPDLFFTPDPHPLWDSPPSPLNPRSCCPDYSSVTSAGRAGCVPCGRNSHISRCQFFSWFLLQKGERGHFGLSLKKNPTQQQYEQSRKLLNQIH